MAYGDRVELRDLALLLGLALASCQAEPELAPVPARPAGLIPRAQVEQPTEGPHLTEAVISGELVMVGNSFDTFAIYELDDELGLALVVEQPLGANGERCTTLAMDLPTASLYCGSDGDLGVFRYDMSDPRAPVLDGEPFNPDTTDPLRASDMVVVGGRLLLARYHRGLASAQIDADGRLSDLQEQTGFGNVRKLDVDDAGRVWALTVDRGLLVLEADPDGTWVERWQLELDGPALGLGVQGSRAAVGLGSAGLAIVELDDNGLSRTHALQPPGVVSAADIHGDVAVAVTLLGPFVYDLREPEAWPEDPRGEQAREAFDEGGARLVGHALAGPWDHVDGVGAMLDGVLIERDDELALITTDWNWVERFAIDIDGFPAAVDLRRGEFVPAEAATFSITLRNPTPFGLRAEYRLIGDLGWTGVELEARADTRVELPSERFEIDTPQLVLLQIYDGDTVVGTPGVTVLRRAPIANAPVLERGHPASGQEFPGITLASGPPEQVVPVVLPTAGIEQRVVFYGIDCAAMWPEIEDLLWRIRAGLLTREQVVLASHHHPFTDDGFTRWGLDDAIWGHFDQDTLPPEIAGQNPYAELYEDGFVLYELPSAAHHPTDYVIGADGRVITVEREYRGEHELAAQ
jgi:hypothetical protein